MATIKILPYLHCNLPNRISNLPFFEVNKLRVTQTLDEKPMKFLVLKNYQFMCGCNILGNCIDMYNLLKVLIKLYMLQ